MKVRCIQTIPTAEQRVWLGASYPMTDDCVELGSELHIGHEYGVYGMAIIEGRTLIIIDLGDLQWAYEPLLLFEIINPSVSQYWQVHADDDGDMKIAPAAFFEHPYLLDDASEDDPDAIKVFREVQTQMRAEFNS